MFFANAYKEGINNFWYYLITIFVTFIGMILGGVPLLVLVVIGTNRAGIPPEQLQEQLQSMDFSALGFDPNITLAMMLLQFVFGMAFLYLMVKTLHKKRFASLISATNRVNFGKILRAFLFWFFVMAVMELVSYWMDPQAYEFQFQPERFFVLLLVSLLLLPIQTSFEEIFIRGYLMQGIGIATRNRLAAMILSSIVFAALHGANPELATYGTGKMLAYYFLIGMFFATITVMDDSLEIPIGFHFANNFFSATIVTYEGSALQTPALFVNKNLNTDGMLIGTVILIVLTLIYLKHRRRWPSFRKILEPIRLPEKSQA